MFWTVTVFVGSDISTSKNEAVVCFKLNVPVAPLVSSIFSNPIVVSVNSAIFCYYSNHLQES